MITPEELRTLLKKHRWTIAIRASGRQQVFTAKQRQGKKIATCYIGTSNKLNILTEEAIVEKITRSAAPGQEVTKPYDQAHDQKPENRSPALTA